jgi:helicase MOV-10
MERLMDTDEKYQRFENEYDHDFVIQLKQNYRNHPAIMHFSNENFYDSQLVSVCSDDVKNYALDPELLLFNSQFPIIFHTTRSLSEEVGTSLMNEGELIILSYYIRVLLNRGLGKNNVEQSDIGIISPYRGQRDRMLEVFSDDYPNIEIGTVDSFQGREKKIIFMSCVRSGTSHVGFLRNEKRLNVALTRAQSLLIIIGNAATLQKCSIWNKFITYCYENKATVGDVFSVNHDAIGDDAAAGKEVLPADGSEDEYDV